MQLSVSYVSNLPGALARPSDDADDSSQNALCETTWTEGRVLSGPPRALRTDSIHLVRSISFKFSYIQHGVTPLFWNSINANEMKVGSQVSRSPTM